MAIDVNDLKILINAGIKYLIKTCHQWAKDHPLVSGVLLFFYLLYIFFPNLFDILFYIFPLIICIAIILGGKHIRKKDNQEQHTKNNKKYEVLRTMSIDHRRCRRQLTSQISRRTLERTLPEDDNFCDSESSRETSTKIQGPSHNAKAEEFSKDKNSTRISSHSNLEGPSQNAKAEEFSKDKNSTRISSHSNLENETEISKKLKGPSHEVKKEEFPTDKNSTGISSHSEEKKDNVEANKSSTGISSHSDTESQEEDENDEHETRESRNKVIEWTEDDQRNLMDLGSSEIERNKRLESLIAKRRARKLLSMQPRRNHYPYENLMDQVGSIMVTRFIDTEMEHQPGSAPCGLRSIKNPFDLPYDPHEEKPILTGGSFDEEFFNNHQKDFLTEDCSNKSDNFMSELMEDHLAKSLPSFFTNPKSVEKPRFTRFQRESEENLLGILEGHPKEDTRDDQAPDHQDLPEKVQSSDDTSLPLQNKDHHELENPFAKNFDPSELDSINSSEKKNKNELESKDKEVNIFGMDTINNQREDDEDSTSSSSSSSSSSTSSTEMAIDAHKNEAFRNSVKKVLNCLIIQRSMGNNVIKGNKNVNLIPHATPPTKMEERSFYTSSKPHHTTTFSIASDMQVEVSETGSPPLATLDPSSPTDRESLVYDGDVDKDANSGDEDLWGASPHPLRHGEFVSKFKLPDITEEGNKQMTGDQRSIDAEIIESGSSVSSSSDGLTSQMQAKTEHLAEYLANLPPTSQTGSTVLEEPEPEQEPEVEAEVSAENHPFEDETQPIEFKLDEAKDESREGKEMEKSHPRSSATNEIGAIKETDLTSGEQPESEPTCQEIHIGVLDNQPRIIEDKPSLVENDVLDSESHIGEQIGQEKETIPDSYSTTCLEEIFEQSRLEERGNVNSKEDKKILHDDELINNSANDVVIHEKSTLSEKSEDNQANHAIFEDKKLEVDDQTNHAIFDDKKLEPGDRSIESENKLGEVDDAPQPATIEEDNMESSSSIDAVNSRPVDDSEDNSEQSKT
ncbi:uncharacterized protein LOC141621024 [Silene latifolia]|uniref:uncharacterized protein LOC141621024 n=1 Tax=Silene latifolia TaxID=37657 RepID=UPI003D7715FC